MRKAAITLLLMNVYFFAFSQSDKEPENAIALVESFTGNYDFNTNSVKFNWTTLKEVNSDYFIIDRSEDMENFIEICKVNAAGNTNATSSYNCTDIKTIKGISYYRLRFFNDSGKELAFDPLSINVMQTASSDASHIIPNPNDGLFRLLVPTSEELVHIKIMNELAQPLRSLSIKNSEPNFYLSLDMRSDIAKGIYYLKIDASEASYIKRVQVVNRW